MSITCISASPDPNNTTTSPSNTTLDDFDDIIIQENITQTINTDENTHNNDISINQKKDSSPTTNNYFI